MITFACCKGNGCHRPCCKARGSVHGAVHSWSQAGGSRGGILDGALPPCGVNPLHAATKDASLLVSSCACFVLGPLYCYGKAERLNKSWHARGDVVFHLGKH